MPRRSFRDGQRRSEHLRKRCRSCGGNSRRKRCGQPRHTNPRAIGDDFSANKSARSLSSDSGLTHTTIERSKAHAPAPKQDLHGAEQHRRRRRAGCEHTRHNGINGISGSQERISGVFDFRRGPNNPSHFF